jgi:hypothetical protein
VSIFDVQNKLSMRGKFNTVLQLFFRRIDIAGWVIAIVVISNDYGSGAKTGNTKGSNSKEPVKSQTINCISAWEK